MAEHHPPTCPVVLTLPNMFHPYGRKERGTHGVSGGWERGGGGGGGLRHSCAYGVVRWAVYGEEEHRKRTRACGAWAWGWGVQRGRGGGGGGGIERHRQAQREVDKDACHGRMRGGHMLK